MDGVELGSPLIWGQVEVGKTWGRCHLGPVYVHVCPHCSLGRDSFLPWSMEMWKMWCGGVVLSSVGNAG